MTESWLWIQAGRRVCREGREKMVGGSWQRERKQRRIVSSVQGGVCAILAVSPVIGTCWSHVGPLLWGRGWGG